MVEQLKDAQKSGYPTPPPRPKWYIFFRNFFSFDKKKSFLLGGKGGSPLLLVVRPLEKHFDC